MDAFFASVEQRDYVGYQGIPLIVGSIGKRRGVVAAASYEAREFGVFSSMPMYLAKQMCPQAKVVNCNIDKYREVSRQIHTVFRLFANKIQPVSMDEAYLDVTEKMKTFSNPVELGNQIKVMVKELTRLNISVGIGPNKMLAKLICSASKPDGLGVIFPKDVQCFLRPMSVRKLNGIGPVTESRLSQYGFNTLHDIETGDVDKLERVLGKRRYAEIRKLSVGEDDGEVEPERKRKSYVKHHTFQYDATNREEIFTVLEQQSRILSQRLKADNEFCRAVTLKIKLGKKKSFEKPSRLGLTSKPHEAITRCKTLGSTTNDEADIFQAACFIWDELALFDPVKLIGIQASKLGKFKEEESPQDLPNTFDFFS